MMKDDLKRVLPLWVKYTEDVRADPEVGFSPSACTHVFRRMGANVMTTSLCHRHGTRLETRTPSNLAKSHGLLKCMATPLAPQQPTSGIRRTMQQCCTHRTCRTTWQVRSPCQCFGMVLFFALYLCSHCPCTDSLFGSADVPNVLHYGLLFQIKETGYKFDKHWYQNFDALRCPPWKDVGPEDHPTEGLFPFPPHPSNLTAKVASFLLTIPLIGLAFQCLH